MYTVIIVLIIIISILLMLVVLAQNPKGGGLSSQFGGSGTTQLMGVKKTGDFLEKATWALAIALMVATLAASKMAPAPAERLSSPNLDNAGQAPTPLVQPDQSLSPDGETGDSDLDALLQEDANENDSLTGE
jgi:preprotein translocase subunit SecG